ncbi:hypothetical protein AB6A40_000296 [Gnathostoma spinigerum]|uniref:GLE1 RNA export mediator n=1 Tax=Gnathostoma spinigerum TaxID=75299 RepID=A0ABD6E3X4_9BILA
MNSSECCGQWGRNRFGITMEECEYDTNSGFATFDETEHLSWGHICEKSCLSPRNEHLHRLNRLHLEELCEQMRAHSMSIESAVQHCFQHKKALFEAGLSKQAKNVNVTPSTEGAQALSTNGNVPTVAYPMISTPFSPKDKDVSRSVETMKANILESSPIRSCSSVFQPTSTRTEEEKTIGYLPVHKSSVKVDDAASAEISDPSFTCNANALSNFSFKSGINSQLSKQDNSATSHSLPDFPLSPSGNVEVFQKHPAPESSLLPGFSFQMQNDSPALESSKQNQISPSEFSFKVLDDQNIAKTYSLANSSTSLDYHSRAGVRNEPSEFTTGDNSKPSAPKFQLFTKNEGSKPLKDVSNSMESAENKNNGPTCHVPFLQKSLAFARNCESEILDFDQSSKNVLRADLKRTIKDRISVSTKKLASQSDLDTVSHFFKDLLAGETVTGFNEIKLCLKDKGIPIKWAMGHIINTYLRTVEDDAGLIIIVARFLAKMLEIIPGFGDLLVGKLCSSSSLLILDITAAEQTLADIERRKKMTSEALNSWQLRESALIQVFINVQVHCWLEANKKEGYICEMSNGPKVIWQLLVIGLKEKSPLAACLVYEILEVSGWLLKKIYRSQFVKLIALISSQVLPGWNETVKLKEYQSSSTRKWMAELFLSRLEILLEQKRFLNDPASKNVDIQKC